MLCLTTGRVLSKVSASKCLRAISDIEETSKLIETASLLNQKVIRKTDSLHLACAILSKCEYFLTTDNEILRRAKQIDDINIDDPIGFIKEVLS